MKALIFLLLLGIEEAAAVTHSLKYFLTASSQVPNFPEFVIVGMLDEVQMDYYNSDTQKAEPKQDWMNKVTVDDPQYWERQSSVALGTQQSFKANIETAKERFNQTGGTHIFQQMYGCEWDDENQDISGFNQYGYDGEDFIVLDMKNEAWIAPTPQAVITKHKWDKTQGVYWKNALTGHCIDWLKKYLDYGKSTLQRKENASVSLLQKSPSSPVTCHATGFYTDRAEMFWRKDGEELHEGVDKGQILTNNDGTFQMSVDLKLSSVTPEDWRRYDCVFQLSGVKDIITKLEKKEIRTNKGNSLSMIIPVVVAVVVLAVIAVIAGFIIYKKRTDKRPPSPVENREVQEQMIPKA